MSARHLPAQKQLKALSQVIHKRLDRAENTLNQALAELRKIELEIQERTTSVNSLNENIQDVLLYLSDDVATKASQTEGVYNQEAYQRGLQRRYWLDYDRQREQYYLEMTLDELKAQQLKVAEARSVYLALKYKCDLMGSKLNASLRANQAKRLAKHDAERADSALLSLTLAGGTQ